MKRRHGRIVSRVAAVTVLGLGLTAGAIAAAGAGPSQPEQEVVAKELAAHPIAAMVGLWRGSASRLGREDAQWHSATGVERARWNLAGTAILVEGYGYIDLPDTGERVVGHDATGFIEWDDDAHAPVFFTHLSGGAGFARHAMEVVGETGQIRWGFDPAPGVTMRFTITLTEERWHEIGEMSRDEGETWVKVLETDLRRVSEWRGPASAR